ncbi:MAG: hypothetical protein ACTSYR_04010 [Candidatus Odinarchaeia archaeon]
MATPKELIIDLPNENDSIIVRIKEFHINIKHNDIGISIDLYKDINDEPIASSKSFYFGV